MVVLRSVAMLLVISMVAFAIINAMPADPVDIAIHAWNLPSTPETIAALREQWGLDVPLVQRYFIWLGQFVTGDWGRSFRTGGAVLPEFITRLPLSLSIGLGGLLIAMVCAIPLGFASARWPGGIADRFTRALAILVQAVPSFFIGLLIIWVFAVKLRWFRAFGTDLSAIILPIGLIALHSLGVLSRVYRRGILEIVDQPFMTTAKAKGLSPSAVLWHHGHRFGLFALLSAARSEAAWAVGAAAALEILFNVPGISQFMVQSVGARDYFVLQAYVMVVACWLLILNAVVETAIRRLDPRAQ